MFKFEKVYPEYLWGHYGEVLPQPQSPDHLWLKTLKLYSEWYDEVDTWHGRNLVMHFDNNNPNAKKHLMRLKPEYRSRMIRSGYSQDPQNQKSMGMLLDLNRAFVGYQSPLNQEWERIKNETK